jgi:N-methylhydantoinase A
VLARSDSPDTPRRVREALDALEAEARDAMLAEGADGAALHVERSVDARYVGQSFELDVAEAGWIDRFHEAHLERYGYERRGAAVEAVTLRVVVSSAPPTLAHAPLAPAAAPPVAGTTRVVLGGEEHDAALLERNDLLSGHEVRGPAVIREYSGTTWVPPDATATVDAWGCIHLTFGT